ncbi:Omega-amino acid--pyruvate aminotransferase [compost metagenome]
MDLRAYGLVAGIELASREGAPGARAYDALVAAFDAGLLIRTTGDTIAMSPPLVIERKDVDWIVETLAGIIDRLD